MEHCWHTQEQHWSANEPTGKCCWCGATRVEIEGQPTTHATLDPSHGPHVAAGLAWTGKGEPPCDGNTERADLIQLKRNS